MKNVIVTGASGNLGKAIVKKFLTGDYNVIGTSSKEKKSSASDTHYETVAVDLSDEAAAHKFIADVQTRHDRIDVAILTVGGFAMGSIANSSTADIAQQYKLNFETTYNVARPVFVQMIKQGGGRIFLVGSRPGLSMHDSKGKVGYGLAKSLIFRLAELLNEEGHTHNVVTSVIVPSTIDTPENRAAMPDADTSKWVTAEAIADLVYFHCSDEASVLREPIIKAYNNA